MANRIRVAVVAKSLPKLSESYDQSTVDAMITGWRGHLEPVLHDRPDVVVLPENCDRCWPATATFDQYMQYYETRGDQFLDFLADTARKHRCYITCPTRRKVADGTWRNSIQIVGRDGQVVGSYDKMFPTVPEMGIGVMPGDDSSLIECDFGKVACAICFDLNFEELRASYAAQRPDLILFSSVYHGGLMQAYWAYSCRAHFAAAIANLPSTIYNPVGVVLATTTNYTLAVTREINLDCRVAHLDNNWLKFAEIKRTHGPDVTIFDPGLLAPVVITSESDEFTADDLIKKYEMEELDPYFERSRAVRQEYLAASASPASA